MSKTKIEKEVKPLAAIGKVQLAGLDRIPRGGQEKQPGQANTVPPDGGWRETIESVAMAVILALLFRGFVAEAFVIPTGSMAPTLDGRHKDVWCSKCGVQYQVSASDEHRDEVITGLHVSTTTCPICRYTQTLDPLKRPNQASFSGDRVIVGKFAYDLAEPQRWDVIVFKYPDRAVQNYIKRLVGLPNEKLWIVGGNIYTCGQNEPIESLRIARKPPHKLDALLQLVDDTDHIPQDLTDVGWPSRWQAWPATASAWQTLEGGRAFVIEASHAAPSGQAAESWLRYRHLVPTHDDWQTIEVDRQLPSNIALRAGELIADYYAYNTPHYVRGDPVSFWRFPLTKAYRPPANIDQQPGPGDPPNYPYDLWRANTECFGQHWVDDLALECLAEVTGNQGELSLLLVRGGARYICRIDLTNGKATLSIAAADGQPQDFLSDDGQTKSRNPTASTSVRGPGRYRLRLSNCDHELLLTVNDSVVTFDGPTTYDSDDLIAPVFSAADPGDLAPAGVASRGATVKLTGLKIFRDKYYIASTGTSNDYDRPLQPDQVRTVFQNPSQWASSGLFAEKNRRHEEFILDKDQFMPLGDNSPQSSDARFWHGHHYVERDLLIGKALLIYWPHTWNRPIPFTPNFPRMGPIR
jgi:signal peptidase I